jgi:lactoylglutathione lyase
MADLGLTHVAFSVRDVDASVAFYEKYAGIKVIDRRAQDAIRVVWLTDGTRPFIIVLIETADPADTPLGPLGHLGVACESRAEVDQRCAEAEAEGRLRRGGLDSGPPVGYTAFLIDPDGNSLELSYGQEVGLAVAKANPE